MKLGSVKIKCFINRILVRHLSQEIKQRSSCDSFRSLNIEEIGNNIKKRNGNQSLEALKDINLKMDMKTLNSEQKISLMIKLKEELNKLPNNTHPAVLDYGNEPKCIDIVNNMPEFNFKPKEFSELCKLLKILRIEHLGNFCGQKSYYLMQNLAEMEHALVKYSLIRLKKKDFEIITVPDIISPEIIEACGMPTTGDRTQVYKLANFKKCLSGTSEMAFAGYFQDKILNEESLPIKLATVSRCFRAETSGLKEEKGIFRVHQFTKVEMFSVCHEDNSENILKEFKDTQITLFEDLGLHFRVLDMPPSELASAAYRKYDIEAFMPGRDMWGEISSCSNCTDYQTKRLNIQYKVNDVMKYPHTVNGTACAVPRMLIAILETNQKEDNSILIPLPLREFMRDQKYITKNQIIPDLKLNKSLVSPL